MMPTIWFLVILSHLIRSGVYCCGCSFTNKNRCRDDEKAQKIQKNSENQKISQKLFHRGGGGGIQLGRKILKIQSRIGFLVQSCVISGSLAIRDSSILRVDVLI